MKLVIKNLTKTYKNGVKAIDDLSLDIGTGMFGLLGPNGAGKSSLMRTIATLQSPDSGSIYFGDIDVLEDNMSLRKILGYLPQSFGVYPKMSAEDLLDYFATLKGVSSKTDRQALVKEVLEITNLYDVRKKYVAGYSGGMKQRFGIAQLLLNNPKLIIVDEPTAGLDPAERNRFLNVLREVGTNCTVIFSTHRMESVEELCDDIALIHKSNKILDGKLVDIKREYKINTFEVGLRTDNHDVLRQDLAKKFSVSDANFKTLENELKLNVKLQQNESPNELLNYLTAKGEVSHFVELIPSVNDIFIQTVNNN